MLDQATTIGLLCRRHADGHFLRRAGAGGRNSGTLHAKDGAGVYPASSPITPQQKLSDSGEWPAKAYQAKYNEAPTYGSAEAGFGDVAIIAQAVDLAKSIDPKAVVKAPGTGTFKSWADAPVTFSRRRRRLLPQLVPADPDPAIHQAEPGLERGDDRGRAQEREMTLGEKERGRPARIFSDRGGQPARLRAGRPRS